MIYKVKILMYNRMLDMNLLSMFLQSNVHLPDRLQPTFHFVLVLFVTKAGWGVVVRRVSENLMSTLPLFAVLFIVVNMLVKRLILVPIRDVTAVATAVSKGDLNRAMAVADRNDEISDLGQAFELMRRSLITAMKHLKGKS